MSNYTRKRDEQMNNRQKKKQKQKQKQRQNKNKNKNKTKQNNVAMDLCELCKAGTKEIPSTFLAAFKSPTFYS